jgi:hypothetical protein
MLSKVGKADQYHFVVVRNEDGQEERWLLTDSDRERLKQRAASYVQRGGVLIRTQGFFENLLGRFFGGQ